MIDRYCSLQKEFVTSVERYYSYKHSYDIVIAHALGASLKIIDAIHLAERIRAFQPKRILEVGSFLGLSTSWMLEISQPYGSQVVSVDPGLRHRMFDDVRGHLRQFCGQYADRLITIDGCLSERDQDMFLYDYLKFEPQLSRHDALARIDRVTVLKEPFGEFDFAFIDGSHSFHAVVQNTLLVARMMPHGGLIAFHDVISTNQVLEALRELANGASNLHLEDIEGLAFHSSAEHIWRSKPVRSHVGARMLRYICRFFGQHSGLLDIDAVRNPLCDGLAIVRVSGSLEGSIALTGAS
jgi:predicted O-methyltransferase YrrM